MKRFLILFLLATTNIYYSPAQNNLLTVAERSGFKSTSYHEDVMFFVEELKKLSPFIRTENLATSVEGREIPLIIIGSPLPASPEELRNDSRIKVYIQANIHAGEVEGKEASLMYARDILRDKNSAVLKNCILLICPDFNPDGNDKISTSNRTDQNGPENGVGVRYNGQFLDINRDGMKAESPEMRGLLRNVFNRWDPEIFMDCHTTNGSYHVEPVTFTWAVNPNGVIRTSQPLANVAAYLLEPESADGLVFWNYLDKYLVPQWGSGFNAFPVYRVLKAVDFTSDKI